MWLVVYRVYRDKHDKTHILKTVTVIGHHLERGESYTRLLKLKKCIFFKIEILQKLKLSLFGSEKLSGSYSESGG